MPRILILIGALVFLQACASSSSTIVRSVAGTDEAVATKKSILEALDGGLFDRLGIESARRSERFLALEAEYRALEHTPAGQAVPWRSGKSDLAGEVMAAQPYRVGSQDCRTYTHTVNDQGNARSGRGTACRNADGSWTPLT